MILARAFTPPRRSAKRIAFEGGAFVNLPFIIFFLVLLLLLLFIEWEKLTSIKSHRQIETMTTRPSLMLENGKQTWANHSIAVLCTNKRFRLRLRNYSTATDNLFETQDDWMKLCEQFNEQCKQRGLSSGA
jgi:hypothetical protein